MAANNSDSKRIFDSYIEKYLNEQLSTGVSTGDFTGQGWDTKKKEEQKEPAPKAADAGKSAVAASAGMAGVNPYIAGQPKDEVAQPKTDASQVGAGGYGTYNVNQGGVAASGSTAGTPTPTAAPAAAVAQGSTPAPTAAPAAASTSTPAAATKTGAPDDKEKELLKKLHASDYNASSKTDQARLAELRAAMQQAGPNADFEKIRTLSYAQQYGEKSPYYAQAQKMGVNVPKPGQVAPANQSTGSYVAQGNQAVTNPSMAVPSSITPSSSQSNQVAQQSTTTSSGSNVVNSLIQQLQSLTPQEKQALKEYLG